MLKRHSVVLKLIQYIGIILVFLTIFLVMYAPVLQKDFFYRDDLVLLEENMDISGMRDYIIKTDGRLLNGIMVYYLWGHARSSNSAKTMRLFAIIGMALFASAMMALLQRFRVRFDHAFLMSALICTLPSAQIFMLSILCANFIYGALLCILSALIVFNNIKEEEKQLYRMIYGSVAIILLVTSSTIYQPAAMMYWVAGIIVVFTGDTNDQEVVPFFC